jgi:mRNA interferase RelE/StbE
LTYRIEFRRAAAKELAALPRAARERVDACILSLASNPRPPGVKKLSGEESFYRVREGDYRIVYTIEDRVLLVLVVRIGHRREVYR